MKNEILNDQEKKQAREQVINIIETILTLGFKHLYKWIKNLIINKK